MVRQLCLAAVLVACGGRDSDKKHAASGAAAKNPACPATGVASSPLPRVEPAHRTLDYWLKRTQDLDEILLDVDRIQDMNGSLAVERGSDWYGENDLAGAVDAAKLAKTIETRLKPLHDKLANGEYVDGKGGRLDGKQVALFDPARAGALHPELRVALDLVALRCGPIADGFFTKAAAGAAQDTRYDRNACSTAHPQEVIEILGEWPGGMRLARTRYATGFIAADAKLSPAVPDALREALLHGARAVTDDDVAVNQGGAGVLPGNQGGAGVLPGKVTGGAARCPAGTLVPIVPGPTPKAHIATATGFQVAPVAGLQPTRRPLTRRALLTEAFRFLDAPYGWGGGGAKGGHDCSSLIMDMFAAFDVHLPRHSSWQALAGTFSIDVTKVTSADERMRLFDAAATKGVVLLSFPGHIMLYLGREEHGRPMVLHALAEYAQACPGGGETVNAIERVGVSDLDLGRGSSRTSLLERITRITVFGKTPGVELAGAAELRPAAPVVPPSAKACHDSGDVAIFASPRVPNAKQAMRVIVTSQRDPGPAELTLFDGKGKRVAPTSLVRLAGGPPWSVIATLDHPATGTLTAVLGDGTRIEACDRISIAGKPPTAPPPGPRTAAVWPNERTWGRATENLYATFVQRLFDFPPDQDLTWPNLHVLLRDPEHNILFDHLQRGEEGKLALEPDCADLPYLLRAYFAWKMHLPFAYHYCSRGNPTHAPKCEPTFVTNLATRDLLDSKQMDLDPELQKAPPATAATLAPPAPPAPPRVTDRSGPDSGPAPIDDVTAFKKFWGLHVSRAVHAASGRTTPDDENTDYYPVKLTRDGLSPGTVYIDPFGHVMVVSGWVPQAALSYGVLLAADAQPDGTVGRKRFWRGNFLFSTDTKVAGAGFKAFRPVRLDDATHVLTLLDNKALARSRVFSPYSLQQYEGTVDTFFDTVEALVNPRPLDASAALTSLVDSLHSQAKLRLVSIKNGEDFFVAHPGQVVPMPDGADIFLTSGPWEDFATPARDFRLLIAIDTVLAFPAAVKRTPRRFSLEPGPAVDAVVAKLDKELQKLLETRTFQYPRSDGSLQTLTLRDLVDRKAALEIAYDPNDCPELRWGAPAGSPELTTCKRHAPADHKAKLEANRPWFHDRRRPAK